MVYSQLINTYPTTDDREYDIRKYLDCMNGGQYMYSLNLPPRHRITYILKGTMVFREETISGETEAHYIRSTIPLQDIMSTSR